MGAWLSRSLWSSTTDASPAPSPVKRRPPSPTSTLRTGYTPIRKARRVQPLPPSVERVFRGRKHELIVIDACENVRRFVFAGCEDCVVYAPCCAAEIEILDCKRCAFAFGVIRGAMRVRDSHACDVCVGVTMAEIRVEDSRDARVRARGMGSNARFEAVSSAGATLGDCDYEYDEMEEQMASSGFFEPGVMSGVSTSIREARGFVVDESASAYETTREAAKSSFADFEPALRQRATVGEIHR